MNKTKTTDSTQQTLHRTGVRLCDHRFPDAHRCGSPALRNETFCYHHHPTRRRVPNPNERQARRVARQAFDLGMPNNGQQFLIILNELMARIAANEIDTRRAGQLLFAMQIVAQRFGGF